MAGVLFVAAMILMFLGLTNQRRLWWSMNAWSYRNPEQNEPSDAAYRFMRFTTLAGAVILALWGIGLLGKAEPQAAPDVSATSPSSTPSPAVTYGRSAVREKAERALSMAKGMPVEGMPGVIYQAGEGNLKYDVRPTYYEGGWIHHEFEISNRVGDYPVCLTIRTRGRSGNVGDSGEVRDGRC